MTNIEEAKSDFERLGFHIYEHLPYKAPINNPDEIKRLKAELAETKSSKSQAFLKAKLAEQEEEQIEILNATKTFEIFRSLDGKRRPYMHGTFTPKYQLYILDFWPRDLRSNDHPLKDAGRLSFDLITLGGKLEKSLRSYLNQRKSDFGLPVSVSFGSVGQCKIEMAPPFFLQTKDAKIDSAYRDLVSAVKSLGYDMQEL